MKAAKLVGLIDIFRLVVRKEHTAKVLKSYSICVEAKQAGAMKCIESRFSTTHMMDAPRLL